MRMGQGVRTGLGHGGITCVLQTQFSSFVFSDDHPTIGYVMFLTCTALSSGNMAASISTIQSSQKEKLQNLLQMVLSGEGMSWQ